MKIRGSKAFALAFTLLLTTVVVVTVTALLATAGRNLFTASQYHERAIASQAAEAGLARAQSTLESNVRFQGTIREELSHSGGSFELDITNGGTPDPLQSFNNLESSTPRMLPVGELPAHSAFLVSRGSYRGHEVVLKAYVKRAEESLILSLLASNRIDLKNRASIRGIQSFISNTPTSASVHSNRTKPGVAISWVGPNSGDTLTASGKLTASASDDASISLVPRSAATVEDTLANQPLRGHLNYDIEEFVSLHSSSPGPVLPLTGRVVLPPGNHYYSSDQVINGDLVLEDGARLYIEGNLSVNGSIGGMGTVAVTGFTALKGDTHLSTADGNYIALLSREGVALTGFDGTAFMDALASSDANAAQNWNIMKMGMTEMQGRVSLGVDGWVGEINDDQFDDARTSLASPNRSAQGLQQVMPSGPTGEFLAKKFYQMRVFYHNAWFDLDDNQVHPSSSDDEKLAVADLVTNSYLAGQLRPDQGGIADAVSSQDIPYADLPPKIQDTIGRVKTAIQAENLDKLGTAWFKGFVYSNGPIYVANEMTVVGAIESQGLRGVPSRNFGGVTMEAGDIHLAPRSDLIYVNELMKSNIALGRSGLLKILFRFES